MAKAAGNGYSSRPTDTAPVVDSTARARRQMRDCDGQPGLVGERLQLGFPEPHPRPVAAAAVGGDQQPARLAVTGLAEFLPPAPDALHGEGCRVAGDPEINPARVGGDVVDAIGCHLAKLRQHEIVHPHRFGLAFGA